MWEYCTEEIKIEKNSKISIDNRLNEFGKKGWEAFSIESEPFYDRKLQIGKYKMRTATIYTVRFKRKQ